MKIVEEVIAARLLRPHADHRLLADRYDLLEMQIAALEFRNDRIEILYVNFDGPAWRRMQLRRVESMTSTN